MDGVCVFVCLFYVSLSKLREKAQTSLQFFFLLNHKPHYFYFFFFVYILYVYFISLLLFAFFARNHIHNNGKICYHKSVNILMRLGAT